jgi:hypothetical protein
MCTVLLPPGVNPIAANKYIILTEAEEGDKHMNMYEVGTLRYHKLKQCIASKTELQTDLLWFII